MPKNRATSEPSTADAPLAASAAPARRWVRGLTYPLLLVLIAAGTWCMLDARRYTPAFTLALDSLTRNADLAERFGAPLEAGSVLGTFATSTSGQESADLWFSLRGPRAGGVAYLSAREVGSIWRIERLEVELGRSAERLVIAAPDDSNTQARVETAPQP